MVYMPRFVEYFAMVILDPPQAIFEIQIILVPTQEKEHITLRVQITRIL